MNKCLYRVTVMDITKNVLYFAPLCDLFSHAHWALATTVEASAHCIQSECPHHKRIQRRGCSDSAALTFNVKSTRAP